MMPSIFISKDADAIAVGADQVAAAVARAANGRSLEIVRTGSRGLMWLEPLVEVEIAGVLSTAISSVSSNAAARAPARAAAILP